MFRVIETCLVHLTLSTIDDDDETETITTSNTLVGVKSPQQSVHVPLIDLLGEQLLHHSTFGGGGAGKHIATRQLHGKIIGLYFS